MAQEEPKAAHVELDASKNIMMPRRHLLSGSEKLTGEASNSVDRLDNINARALGCIRVDTECFVSSFCAPMLQHSASSSSDYRYVA